MSGDMVELSAAGEGFSERCRVAQVSCGSFDRKTAKVPEVGIRSCQHANLGAGSYKRSCHRRSNKPGGACD
jgi:hypothetical protein